MSDISLLDRRSFAVCLGGLTTGCLTDGGERPSDDSQPGSGSEREQPNGPGSCGRRTSTSPAPYPDLAFEPDPVPEDASVSICIEPVSPFTDEHPARFAVELTNEGDSSLTFGFAISPPYPPYAASHRSEAAELVILPDYREYVTPRDGTFVPDEPDDGCWRALERPGGLDKGLEETLEPGETIREEYVLLGAPDGECLVPGTYRTENERYDPVGYEPWGFEITLSQ